MPRPKPAEPYRALSVRLPPALYKRLSAHAELAGMTVTDMLRAMIRDYQDPPPTSAPETQKAPRPIKAEAL
jgi:hypothetical protein